MMDDEKAIIYAKTAEQLAVAGDNAAYGLTQIGLYQASASFAVASSLARIAASIEKGLSNDAD